MSTPIEIKLSFASIDEAIAYLQGKSTVPATVKVEKAEKPPAAPKQAPQQETKPAAAEASAPAAPAASTASSSEPATLDYDRDVKPLIIKLGSVKNRETVLAVLGTFGVSKGTELAAGQLADAKAALEAALGA